MASEGGGNGGGGGDETGGGRSLEDAPHDAHVMAAILKAMGVESYEDRVVNQLLELLYRYVCEILDDARVYCDHAGKVEPDIDDVKLAVQARITYSFTQPPSREVLLQLARERNSIPLPILENKIGIQLPPEKHQLTSQNYQIKARPKPDPRRVERGVLTGTKRPAPSASPQTKPIAPPPPTLPTTTNPNPNPNPNLKPNPNPNSNPNPNPNSNPNPNPNPNPTPNPTPNSTTTAVTPSNSTAPNQNVKE